MLFNHSWPSLAKMSKPTYTVKSYDLVTDHKLIKQLNWDIVSDRYNQNAPEKLTKEEENFTYHDDMDATTCYVIFNKKDEPVGNLFVLHKDNVAHAGEPCRSCSISYFFIATSHQKKQYGRHLLNYVMKQECMNAWQNHFAFVRFTLRVQLGKEKVLIKYYQTFGFLLCDKIFSKVIPNRIMYCLFQNPSSTCL
jgi:hypothetical protein